MARPARGLSTYDGDADWRSDARAGTEMRASMQRECVAGRPTYGFSDEEGAGLCKP